jgi:hypothetical protein
MTQNENPFLRSVDIVSRSEITPEKAAENKRLKKDHRRPRPAQRGLLPISMATWTKWQRQGRAPKPMIIGGVRMWRRDDLLAFFEQQADQESATQKK